MFSGPNQDENDPDGIGDTPYNISGGNSQDRYPFIQLYDPSHPVENLDTGERFAAIQDAINDANTQDRHTIFVRRNIYYENLVINKTLTLAGVDKNTTIIDGSGSGNTILISELIDGVNISGFTIQNSGSVTHNSGIKIRSDDNIIYKNNIINNKKGLYIDYLYRDSIRNCTIIGNNIINNSCGVYLAGSNGNIISGNNIIKNKYGVQLGTHGTEHGWGSSDNTIIDNNISYNEYGIDQPDTIISIDRPSQCNTIASNNIKNNTRTGIKLWKSNNNNIINNSISKNDRIGIYIDSLSSNNEIFENTITDNNGSGIEFYDRCRQNKIFANIILNNNGTGIYLNNRCRGNRIFENIIINNTQHGIKLCNLSNNGRIYHNNFINSTEENAWDECNTTWYNVDLEEGNYWDDFENNPGYPEGIYEIPPNGANIDMYPLAGPWTPSVPGDTDHDDDVDLVDLAQLLGHYGMESEATWEMGDFDGDGDVDLSDLAELIGNYGYGT
jgi:parallel beta-helix repeat protein